MNVKIRLDILKMAYWKRALWYACSLPSIGHHCMGPNNDLVDPGHDGKHSWVIDNRSFYVSSSQTHRQCLTLISQYMYIECCLYIQIKTFVILSTYSTQCIHHSDFTVVIQLYFFYCNYCIIINCIAMMLCGTNYVFVWPASYIPRKF